MCALGRDLEGEQSGEGEEKRRYRGDACALTAPLLNHISGIFDTEYYIDDPPMSALYSKQHMTVIRRMLCLVCQTFLVQFIHLTKKKAYETFI